MTTTTFHIRVNDGPEQTIDVQTGVYVSAVAAVPAMLGHDEYPMKVEIWYPEVLPHYGPYTYWIERPGGQVGMRWTVGGRTLNVK